jgi:D-psicose/D-tagatose/L-ribulose 3-epimerase
MSMLRRSFLFGAAGLPALAAENRWAICSETFVGSDFITACKTARRVGYSGIEAEPAHLGADPAGLSRDRRREFRSAIDGEGLTCVGIHSMLKSPTGLHLTTADATIRQKSWEYFDKLIDLAADLSDRPVMVLGSSKQRSTVNGASVTDATARLTEGLQKLAPHAAQRSATILMEPLAPHQSDVVTTLEQAMEIVRAVKSPAVQTILDTHNTAAEKLPLDELIRKYLSWIRHVHLNEMDGRRPGAGNFPFPLVLRTLKELQYAGWLSVEIFDFKPDGETVARESFEYLDRAQRG